MKTTTKTTKLEVPDWDSDTRIDVFSRNEKQQSQVFQKIASLIRSSEGWVYFVFFWFYSLKTQIV